MPSVTIYTSPFCGFCHAAKRLLKHKETTFKEINVAKSPDKRQEMMRLAGGRHTVPQIFINGQHVGGCDELYDLDRRGKLDARLTG